MYVKYQNEVNPCQIETFTSHRYLSIALSFCFMLAFRQPAWKTIPASYFLKFLLPCWCPSVFNMLPLPYFYLYEKYHLLPTCTRLCFFVHFSGFFAQTGLAGIANSTGSAVQPQNVQWQRASSGISNTGGLVIVKRESKFPSAS